MNKLAVLEGLLFVVGEDGLTIEQLVSILELGEEEVKQLILDLKGRYEADDRGIRINYLGNTFKLTTKEEHKEYYKKLIQDDNVNTMSQAALETLAIIAYNEPITRSGVDEVRGVYTAPMIRKLISRGLVKEIGRSSLPGRPILYSTTNEFLDYFGLKSIDELPKIEKLSFNHEEVDLYKSAYKESD